MHILHLCMDHNFVSDSRKVFEKYYPGQNTFVVCAKSDNLKMIRDKENFRVLDLYDKRNYKVLLDLCREKGVDKIVLHGMRDYMLTLLPYLRSQMELKIYWLLWGYELYETLGYEKNYPLFDRRFSPFSKLSYLLPNRMSAIVRKLTGNYRAGKFAKVFEEVDYFCFWNKRDYDLLKKYFDVRAQYRFFTYKANERDQQPADLFELRERKLQNIMINHQASVFGNHESMMGLIKMIDKENNINKIVPLSYGHPLIRKSVLKEGKKLFGEKFKPVLQYMSGKDYFALLDSVDVAVFGQRRQEASGNIIQLLKNGVKVFLRNDNNLLSYYREKGYIIFSVEDDLTSPESLTPLTLTQQRHNREIYLKNRYYYDDYMPQLMK